MEPVIMVMNDEIGCLDRFADPAYLKTWYEAMRTITEDLFCGKEDPEDDLYQIDDELYAPIPAFDAAFGNDRGLVFIWLVVNRILNDPTYDKTLEDFAPYLAGKKGVLTAGFLRHEVSSVNYPHTRQTTNEDEVKMCASEIRWGILGAGGIAKRFAASLETVEGARLVAVSGRSAERLAAFAPARIYADGSDGSSAHASLLADPEVDAIYLALPHSMHLRWVLEAMRAGKPVLCEKPAVLTEAEARQLAGAVRGSSALFMEAMKCRFVPLHARVRALIDSGELGRVCELTCSQRVDYGEDNLRYLVDPVGGGALYDLGCYPMSWVEELTQGNEPQVSACANWRDVSGGRVDWSGDATLDFEDVRATIHWAGDSAEYDCSVLIRCERGSVLVERAHRPERAVVSRPGTEDEVISAPYDPDDFHGEIAHFCELMRAGATESPVMPLAATIRNARLIDAVRAVM